MAEIDIETIDKRWRDATDGLSAENFAEVSEAERVATAYAHGWRDARGEDRDSAVPRAFGHAYSTVVALRLLGRIAERPSLNAAWVSWDAHGHIMNSGPGEPRALNLVDPHGPFRQPEGMYSEGIENT